MWLSFVPVGLGIDEADGLPGRPFTQCQAPGANDKEDMPAVHRRIVLDEQEEVER